MEVTWADVKSFVTDRNLSVQWVDLFGKYYIKAFDGAFMLECTILKLEVREDDQIDFEDNYKNSAIANTEVNTTTGLKDGGVYGELELTTGNVAYEAKVGVSRLPNRKMLTISIGSSNIWFGLNNSVTTLTGTPTTIGQFLSFECDANSTFQVWLVGNVNTKTAKITEIP